MAPPNAAAETHMQLLLMLRIRLNRRTWDRTSWKAVMASAWEGKLPGVELLQPKLRVVGV